ncbi:MAG: hypothetical protein LBQ68_05240, partial [Clostridiales bacterium]|nr:hypothetical protein [Clostridiales bacterium]
METVRKRIKESKWGPGDHDPRRTLALFTVFCLLVLLLSVLPLNDFRAAAMEDWEEPIYVEQLSELQDALSAVEPTSKAVIALKNDIYLEGTALEIPGQGKVMLTSAEGGPYKIDANAQSRVIEIEDNGDLTLENITITGGTATNVGGVRGGGGGVYVGANGSLTLTDNTEILANKGYSDTGGTAGIAGASGVHVADTGTFTVMGKAKISGNQSFGGGGAVSNYGTFIIKAGAQSKISGNTTNNSNGGGVTNHGTFTVETGAISEISDNTVSGNFNAFCGGGVYNNGSFTIETGSQSKISGNSAVSNGGGVYFGNSVFNMKGGTIEG